jgi:voltage-gated potassium channel
VHDAAFTLPAVSLKRRRRTLLATSLYFRYLLIEFRWSLGLLAAAVLLGTILFHIPVSSDTGLRPSIPRCIYASWMALLAQQVFPPDSWYVAIINATYPLLGLVLVGEGIVRLALLMVSKRQGEKEWMKVMASTYRNHFIVCGLGRLGYRVTEQLLAQQMEVVTLEKDEAGRFVPMAKALGVPVLIRDMKEDQALLDAGIAHARAIVICTNDDLANLEVALDSRRMNPGVRVVMGLFDQEIAQKIAGAMTVDAVFAAFSASTLAAPMVAAMSMGAKVLASMSIGGVAYTATELIVDEKSGLIGKRVEQVETSMQARALALLRNHINIAPPLAMHVLQNEDLLIMCSPTKSLGGVQGRLGM